MSRKMIRELPSTVCRYRSRYTNRGGIVHRAPRLLKPRMLIGGVVQHHLDDDSDVAVVGSTEVFRKSSTRAVAGRTESCNPRCRNRRHAEEKGKNGINHRAVIPNSCNRRASGRAAEVPDAIAVAVVEGADVDLINDRVFVPQHIPVDLQDASSSPNISPLAKQGATQVYMK